MFFNRQLIKRSELSVYLKSLREEKGVSLEQGAGSTGISLKYLRALEDGNFSKLPGVVYVKNFLKIYINYLDGDVKEGLALFELVNFETAPSVNQKARFNQKPRVIFTPKRIKIAGAALLILAVLGYFIYEMKNLSTAPGLEIYSPQDNEKTANRTVVVDGRVGSEAKVFVNQEQIFVSADGTFKETVDLQNGLNTITIKATNKKEKTTTLERRILVQE